MKKNRNSLFTISTLLVCIGTFLVQSSMGQEATTANSDSPQKSTRKNLIQNYVDISGLPLGERGGSFSELLPEYSSRIFRFHLAYQLLKRPNLNESQKEIIVEGIANITSDSYDQSKDRAAFQAKALELRARMPAVFTKQETFEIFASIGGQKDDIERLRKYQNITTAEHEVNRRFLFTELSAQDKSDVMRIHMSVQVAERNLTMEQLKLMSEAIVLCTPEAYSRGYDNASPTVKSLFTRIAKFFQKQEAREIFASLGGSKDEAGAARGWCSCATGDDWCSWWGPHGSICVRNGPEHPCTERTDGGCGYWIWTNCNGSCVVDSSTRQ